MENTVIFRDNQETQAADFNNMEQWVSDSIDHVVLDAIEYGSAYAGFAVSKAAPTQIAVAPGRLYSKGAVYANAVVSTIDLYNNLPVTQQKQIAVVCWGSVIQQDVQPRDFIIDADTGQSQPQSVAMTSTRYCNVDVVPGVEGASPTYPAIDATDTLIAYVLVDPTGIISIQQITATQIDSVQDLSMRVSSIEAFDAQVAGQIATLQTALAALAEQFKLYVLKTDFQKLVDLVNLIWQLIHQPAAYVPFGYDNFYDNSQSNIAGSVDGAYAAYISFGLRFPGIVTSQTTTLQLLNPNDPNAVIAADPAGFMLPMPSGARLRMDCSFPSFPFLDERILQYIYWNFTLRHLHPSRHHHYCGIPYITCPPNEVFAQMSQLDPILLAFKFDADSWTPIPASIIASHANEDDADWPQCRSDRLKFFWHDHCDIPYWARTFDNFSHSGNHICQTFLNAQDGWLTGVSLFMFNQLAQPVTLFITYCDDDGTPNLQRGVRRVVLTGAQVTACFGAPTKVGDITVATTTFEPLVLGGVDPNAPPFLSPVRTFAQVPVFIFPLRINFDPVFLEAGKKYGIHVLTTYDHHVCVSDRDECFSVHQGGYWVSGSGGLYPWTGSRKSLRFSLWYATWGQWQGQQSPGGTVRAEIQMQPLSLAGGIQGVDICADAIEPPATAINYGVQIGGNWQLFTSDPSAPTFATNPVLIPFKVVFTGTTDLMPAVSLTASQVKVHGQRATALHHISNDIILGGTYTHAKVIAKVVGYVTGHHTLAASIHYGGLSPGTHKTADVVADIACDDGTLERTWTFNSISVTEFYVELDGTTDGTVDNFVVAQELRFASP